MMNTSLKFSSGDVWGGLAATAVVLPQAMAFGVALLVAHGFDASYGALGGLLGAAILCLVSGITGGTRGLISAPTGPVLVLLGGAMTSLASAGLADAELLINLAMIVFCTGLFQIAIGLTGGGRLIKYIPHPVISGFLTGSAVLMILSQIGPLSGKGLEDETQLWRWLPLATAVATVIATYLGPMYLKKLPGTIAGLLAGTVFFHIAAWFSPLDMPATWLIGQLPALDSAGLSITSEVFKTLSWNIIIPAAMALAILTSLDTLLTAVIADVTTGARHNANIEMIGQGIGQMLTSIAGGMAAAGTTGATVVAVKSGGRRWVGVFAGVTFFLLLLVARDVGSILPISVLAGIILAVSLHMIDLDIYAWAKRKKSRVDGGIAILVTVVTVAYDLMIAVGFGVLIAIIMFIRTQIRSPVVHRRSTGNQVRSVRYRRPEDREILEQNGERIIVYELRGNLFFATADALFDELSGDLNEPNYVILHLRRVQQVDLTAKKYLQQIAARLNKNGGQLIFCNVHYEIGLGKRMQKTFKKVSMSDVGFKVKTFNGMDEALEYAEDSLLTELNVVPTSSSDQISLRENDLCRELTTEDEVNLEKYLTQRTLEKKELLFSRGDIGNEIYMVITGEVEIRLPTTKHHYKRLATCQPGAFFGELALLYPGPRAADAIATQRTELFILDRKGLEQLESEHPETGVNLLMALAKNQVDMLRWSAKEIQHLSEW